MDNPLEIIGITVAYPRYKQKLGQKAWRQGRWAEWLACLYLILKGYRFLQSRYRNTFGEIDLIMGKGRDIIFIEIKFRKTLDDAAFAISHLQQQRLRRAASKYLAQFPSATGVRFDAVLISRSWRIRHLKNAW